MVFCDLCVDEEFDQDKGYEGTCEMFEADEEGFEEGI